MPSLIDLDNNTKNDFNESFALTEMNCSPATIAKVVRVLTTNSKPVHNYVKCRSDISVTGKKMYRQKGTGRARHDNKSAPQFVGGARAHGTSFLAKGLKANKKEISLVKKFLIYNFLKNHKYDLISYTLEEKPSSRKFRSLENNNHGFSIILTGNTSINDNGYLSTKNIKDIVYRCTLNVSILELLKARHIFVTRSAFDELKEFLSQ